MDQKTICLYLELKGMNAMEIYIELNTVLGSNAVSYSTITKYLRSGKISSKEEKYEIIEQNQSEKLIDDAILSALAREPSASVRRIANMTMLPKSSVYRHLTSSLGFVAKHLKWVPHKLNFEQKCQRVEKSKELLDMLVSMKHNSWKYIFTFDESWLYFSTDFELMWLPSEDIPEVIEKK